MLFRHFLTLVCSPTANKELNVYSYAMPTYNSTSAVAPLQIVSSMYGFPITDPTIIGVIASSKIAIFSCRNANCQDYNEAIYLELKNQTFGRSIATTLTANSNLVILYTKTKPGGGYELWLDICRDPLCAIPGVSQVVDSSLTTDVDMWLGYNINQNVPLIVVSDPHTQTLKSYDCNAQGKCKAPVTIISGATNSFSISPYQVTEKKKLVTKNFLMTIATAQPATGTSTIETHQCAADLSSCSPPLVDSITGIPGIVTSVANAITGSGIQQIGYTTFNATSLNTTLYRAADCKVGFACGPQNITSRSFPLEFTPDETTTITAQILCTAEAGCTAFGLAANAFNAHSAAVTSTPMYGIDKKTSFEVEAKVYAVAKYHKPPPKVTIALFVLAGIAVGSTIILVAWRIWVGRPPTPGYTQIN